MITGPITMLNDAKAQYPASELYRFNAAVLGALTVLVQDPEVWAKAIQTGHECMEAIAK
jgi:hypothetical protein